MKRIVTHMLVATGLAIGAVGAAQAHSDLHIGVSLGAPAYVAPAPVYVRPAAPVYGAPNNGAPGYGAPVNGPINADPRPQYQLQPMYSPPQQCPPASCMQQAEPIPAFAPDLSSADSAPRTIAWSSASNTRIMQRSCCSMRWTDRRSARPS